MNIKSRLKTLEKKVIKPFSPFCACESYNGKVYPRYEISYEKNGKQTVEKPIPDFCERCGKPIEKQQLIIQFV